MLHSLKKLFFPNQMRNVIKSSLEHASGNVLSFVGVVILDIIFVLLLFTSSAIIFQNVAENVIGISTLFQEYNSEITEELNAAQDIRSVLSNLPNFTEYYYGLIKWIIFWFVSVYVLFVVFKGLAWGLAAKAVKKTSLFNYWFRFLRVSILWIFLTFLFFVLSIRLSMRNTGSFIPTLEQNAVSIIISILFIVMVYFALLSFGFIQKNGVLSSLRKSFVQGVKKYRYFVPRIFLVFVLLGIGIALLVLIIQIYVLAGLLFGFVVMLPLMHLLRIITLVVVQND